MEPVKWYKSIKRVHDVLTSQLVKGIVDYYTKEMPTDQTKLYQAEGYYYIKTSNPNGVFSYFPAIEFIASEKPARKNLSPL